MKKPTIFNLFFLISFLLSSCILPSPGHLFEGSTDCGLALNLLNTEYIKAKDIKFHFSLQDHCIDRALVTPSKAYILKGAKEVELFKTPKIKKDESNPVQAKNVLSKGGDKLVIDCEGNTGKCSYSIDIFPNSRHYRHIEKTLKCDKAFKTIWTNNTKKNIIAAVDFNDKCRSLVANKVTPSTIKVNDDQSVVVFDGNQNHILFELKPKESIKANCVGDKGDCTIKASFFKV